MKFDIEGRMRNLRLPDGKTALLYSVYEAVTNGIQAIEERFRNNLDVKKGKITVSITNKNKNQIGNICVRDNGIGLNTRHLHSFNVCDTREKSSIGGRGVGRLVWLKAFGKIDVKSVYVNDSGVPKEVEFEFRPDSEDSRVGLKINPPANPTLGTTITMSAAKDLDAKLTLTALTRNLCHHFFHYFIAGSMPTVTVNIGRRSADVGQYISSRMSVEEKVEVEVPNGVGTLTISHVYVDPKIAQKLSNSILLTAQGRVVENVEIEKKFALKGLANKWAYTCVVSSPFLDEKVDQERTSFKARAEEMQDVRDAALNAANEFLKSHIEQIRTIQKKQVVSLLEDHPQLAISVPDVDKYVAKLSPGMADEDIAKTLFTLLYRHDRKVKAQIKNIIDGDSSTKSNSISVVEELVQKVSDDAKLRLAEYTIKRHQVIQVAKSMLKYANEDKKLYEKEFTLHDFICPMRRMLTSKDYDDHNLWLVDDLLSYYQFFASDKSLSSLGIPGAQEPDLLFLNPFGFRREGTSDPVVIIEFKRPGDENPSSDPIDQVLGYVDKLRSKTVRDADGAVVSDIGDATPFECIVICDLTGGARRRFERSIAQHPTPDGLGYYGFSPRHHASIRVISYSKLFRDAEIRNQSFFKRLGLLPQEVSKAIADSMRIA